MDFDVKPKRIVESDIVSDSIQKIDKLQSFLELNRREFSILVEVYYLNQDGINPDAKHARQEYVEWYMKDISAEQVEKALANLKEKGFLKGDEKFQVDVNKVIEFIVDKNTKGEGEKLQDSIINNIEYYLHRAHQLLIQPLLLYLPTSEIFNIIISELKRSKKSKVYITSNFPSLLYNDKLLGLYPESVREQFELINESISKKELEVVNISRLDTRELYEDSLKALDTKEEALKESLQVLDSIKTHVKLENLKIYYLGFPFGLDGVLLVSKRPTDFFLKIRNHQSRVTGGIYMKSPLIATQVRRIYEETMRNATEVTEKNCDRIIDALKNQLMKVYNNV